MKKREGRLNPPFFLLIRILQKTLEAFFASPGLRRGSEAARAEAAGAEAAGAEAARDAVPYDFQRRGLSCRRKEIFYLYKEIV